MLAIVIPYYKLEFFKETLESLSNQTDKRFRVYIGDDASPENPQELLFLYEGKFEFIYHRFEENLGGKSLTKQWERCIDLTFNEEWLMILGDDDFLGDDVVESWYSSFDIFNTKSEVIRFASKLIYEDTKTLSESYFHPVWENATDSFYRKFKHLTRSSLSEYIFSKKSFLKFRFSEYPLAWNSDDHAWLSFSDQKPIYTINKSLVYVRISSLNISGKLDNQEMKGLSSIKFYRFLISEKIKFYKPDEQENILRFYENEIKKQREIKLSEWFLLLFFYLKNLDFSAIKKFCKRFIKNILKRSE